MLQGFKDFILRGNVIELAVAVVVGSAFQKVVDTFVSSIVTPIINAVGAPQSSGLGFSLRPDKAEATFINFSTIINAFVVFIITAAVVYFIFVLPMNKLAERRAKGVEPEPEVVSEDIALLREIRDELAAQRRQA
ncbi:large conductance mechanosensitive channel protein MscL [Dermatophilus congolensis]|uniref:large conductance mechanosensitive channel protein MscL n=1 Tax=Dermatophilus congolensis TaxID=1863 RepID=UPI001AAF7BB3|nr:large conductance mechanosensitive channel protein MscL [Dermatophilus congolensis]MBO3143326.1 large conductance mechanosensitive channel protein MscL [Dermatophilus congolensis]MBO3152313.1 large conductance mechanosensitive channel protein MscL [Dermatophilus congolensis]MBO3160674.1 large conductance mechanosensitive channel protein MscL [Dermatophilus congolensis]MBO3163602.1 large conductance mechanosensitive channel protein MscL [Dermatophilus congolensis]MBO3177148.1 large conductan